MFYTLTYEANAKCNADLREMARCLSTTQSQGEMSGAKPYATYWRSSLRYFLVQYLYAAMCLEAFIYDYAAVALGDTYVQKYLDKLDLIAKWVIIPRLVLGREVSRDGQAFEYLKLIKKERDKLAHSKSRPALTEEQREKELMEYYAVVPHAVGLADSKAGTNMGVFGQLTHILDTLKKLEKECGCMQDWWEIVELPA